jgi:hypothetical protein
VVAAAAVLVKPAVHFLEIMVALVEMERHLLYQVHL